MQNFIKTNLIKKTIISYFEKEIKIEKTQLNYFSNTFSCENKENIQNVFKDKENSEIVSFISLLLFPKLSLKIRIEAILDNQALTKDDEAKLLLELLKEDLSLFIFFKNFDFTHKINLDHFYLNTFIKRCHLSFCIPTKLTNAIDKSCIPNKANYLKIKIRNSKNDFSKKEIDFLESFFDQKEYFADFIKSFDFLLQNLHTKNHENILEYFKSFKDELIEAKDKTIKLKKELSKSNMESIMAKRGAPVFLEEESLTDKIEIIDEILRICF